MSEEQTEIEGMGPNVARYLRLSEPFASLAEAKDALEAFWSAVGKVREEHKIPDVVVGVRIGYIDSEGDPNEIASCMSLGDRIKAEAIAAFTFGHMSHERETMIADALKMARRGR